ncbi:serine/threonine-protein kinase 16 [Populus alba x Populus x berolinensis]|uniref:non-specific serine/threonine protein kinase n=1 Tax=Populus alba x Populus x berolinensis TaxID=444605 RepID=A0AAD6LN64_9ROSI|nr:serine/threonine-protein kinase 16 [Populus alba x Populus x berolinensis]
MGCSFSGLNALYDAVNGGGDVWINENRFRIVRQLGEGGFAYVFLVKELVNASSPASGGGAVAGGLSKKVKDKSHLSGDGTYAMKKVLIQNNEQLELVREEIHVSSLFNHPNLLPLLDHAIIAVKATQEGSWNHEAYLLFPVHLDGTLLDNSTAMKAKKEFFSTTDVLQIFRQLCAGLKHMHNLDPSYAHNDVKPGNVLLTHRQGKSPLAILMDFGSARPAKRQIRSRSDALQLQEWASEHCSAPFRAPELWDCPSHADIDERTDIWSLGCTLYAIMYGVSPFEYALGESGGSLQLAIVNAQIKWPAGPKPPYPESLHQFVTWMLQPQAAVRPRIDDIIIHTPVMVDVQNTKAEQSSSSLFKRLQRDDFLFLAIAKPGSSSQQESCLLTFTKRRLWKKGHSSLLELTLYPLINLIGCSFFFFFFSTHKRTHHHILIFTVMVAVTTEATKMTA